MDIGSLTVSGAALVVSLLSFYFSIKSWRESNRPIVTARVTSFDPGGELGTALNIVVENTGTRPARKIRLTAKKDDLDKALRSDGNDTGKRTISRCFSDRGVIPVVGNGKAGSNEFGWLSTDSKSAWTGEVRFDIEITYEDLDGRQFRHTNPLLIAGDEGFAGSSWENQKKYE